MTDRKPENRESSNRETNNREPELDLASSSLRDTKRMATALVSAYVSKNPISIPEFKELCSSIFSIVDKWDEYDEPDEPTPATTPHAPLPTPPPAAPLLTTVTKAPAYNPPNISTPASPPRPAVPISQSVTHDYIVCLDDGQKCVLLKHHLTKLGMTPEQYRAKWGLPPHYPMAAQKWSERRSAAQKAIMAKRYYGSPATSESKPDHPLDPGAAPQPFVNGAPINTHKAPPTPPKPSQTALADALREAAEHNPDAANALPLPADFAQIKAVQRHAKRHAQVAPVKVEVIKKRKINGAPVSGRAAMFAR